MILTNFNVAKVVKRNTGFPLIDTTPHSVTIQTPAKFFNEGELQKLLEETFPQGDFNIKQNITLTIEW